MQTLMQALQRVAGKSRHRKSRRTRIPDVKRLKRLGHDVLCKDAFLSFGVQKSLIWSETWKVMPARQSIDQPILSCQRSLDCNCHSGHRGYFEIHEV